jgi:hypothetical protein
MLLIGMKTSLMIYPTTPITANPTAHELAILVNSKELKKKYTRSVWFSASFNKPN